MSLNGYEIFDNDKDIIFNYFNNNNKILKKECDELKRLNRDLHNEVIFLEECKENILNELKNIIQHTEIKDIKKDKVPSKYNLFIKKNYPDFKLKYPDMKPQNIMKELAILWKKQKI
jgi:hypothetical protein